MSDACKDCGHPDAGRWLVRDGAVVCTSCSRIRNRFEAVELRVDDLLGFARQRIEKLETEVAQLRAALEVKP
jgi:hypothetical protein